MLNLSKLPYFIGVAEAGNISRAAGRLRVAQPVLSRYIKTLEDDIGAALFTRDGRGVSLTQEGQRLYKKAKTILNEFEAAELDISAPSGPLLATVRAGMVPWIAESLVVRLAQGVQRTMPRVGLHIIEGQNGSLIEWLDQGLIDVGISYYEFYQPQVEVEPIYDEELYLLGADDNPLLARTAEIDFADAIRLPLVLPPRPHPLRLSMERKATAMGRELEVVLESEAASIASYIAIAGAGFTLIPKTAFLGLKQKGLRAVRLRNPTLTQTLVLMTSLTRPLSNAQKKLCGLARHHLIEIRDELMQASANTMAG